MVVCALLFGLALLVPSTARATDAQETQETQEMQETQQEGPTPQYKTLDELEGKHIAYVNGSVYNQNVQKKISGTSEDFYASLADCVAAVEAGKADAAVQLSYCCQLVVNRKGGSVALVPDPIDPVQEAFFFPKGSPLKEQFNEVLAKLKEDGTLDLLAEKWVGKDDDVKTLPEQDWEAPNGTLKFATSGVIEPFSYVGKGGKPMGYDVELALLIAKELGYHLDTSTIAMDAIFASVQSGKVDFGGTLTNTPERSEMVDFSDRVMDTYISAVVKSEAGATDSGGFLAGIKRSFEKTFIEESRWRMIAHGLLVTIAISVFSGLFGVLLGVGTVFARRSSVGWLHKLVHVYQTIVGGVPMVVVLMVLYYVLFGSVDIPGEIVAIIAFSLAFGSTSGATMWSAVQGIDVIQEETGLALGYTSWQVFRKIIFPQARIRFTPQLMAQFVSLVKETSIVGYIAVEDLTRASDLIRARTMDAFFPLISTAIIYFVFCRFLAWVLAKIANRINGADGHPTKLKGVEQ